MAIKEISGDPERVSAGLAGLAKSPSVHDVQGLRLMRAFLDFKHDAERAWLVTQAERIASGHVVSAEGLIAGVAVS